MRTHALCLLVTALAAGCATTRATTATPAPSGPAARLAQNPGDAEATLAEAQRAEADGDLMRAEQYYVRAEKLGIDPQKTLPHVLGVLVSSERLGEALTRCQSYLEDHPDDVRVRYLEALIEIALEHPRDAADDLRLVIAQKPAAAHPYLLLGRLYRDRLGDARGAHEMFRRFLALAPDSRDAAHLRLELAAQHLTTARRR